MSSRHCNECLEQARLLAMSGEREHSMRGKILRLERALFAIAASETATVEDLKEIAKNSLSRNIDRWPFDDNPFESADHDNDDNTYDEIRL